VERECDGGGDSLIYFTTVKTSVKTVSDSRSFRDDVKPPGWNAMGSNQGS
jgi:hypothetical protein